MKKLLVAVVLLVTTMMSAQKGSILLGGNVGFGSEKIGDDKYENFEFSPKVGYQFADHWTAGVEGSITNSKISGLDRQEEYKIGAFARYSTPLSQMFSFYADLGTGYQTRTLDNAKGIYASFDPGVFINMKNGFGVNFSIGGINYNNLSGKNIDREENFKFNFGKTLNIGISKNFGL
ncbi:hypothetical protein J2Y38_002640 [Flavobacterium sp. 2755]|uniref:outer membrane beta-barrel protein n=1 Tax=Flavobacterium sp. 2755 TaxID=2817765 RepID=UPI00286122E2|nr:outer membrane beta-barrel protein [Flavobacterium sp. 2755]MDR6762429.1 hypothetical protein [Flavobacterium sp. 2755]